MFADDISEFEFKLLIADVALPPPPFGLFKDKLFVFMFVFSAIEDELDELELDVEQSLLLPFVLQFVIVAAFFYKIKFVSLFLLLF